MINGNVPRDASNTPMPEMQPALVAIEETYDATISSSTEITLNAATKMIEVTAIDKTVLMKWGTADASTSDWDYVIPANTVRRFAVPVETAATGALYTAVNFIEEAATAKLCVGEY